VSEANAERDLALLSKAKMIEDQCVVVKEAERAVYLLMGIDLKVKTQSSHQKYLSS
jgi:hypothetical protein